MEDPQPEDDARLTPRRHWDTNQSVLDWVTRTQVPREDTRLSAAATARWKAVRDVKLFKGNLVLDCPVPTRILYKVPHGTPPIRDEFTHVRYSALTCHPSEFNDSKFVLRPSLFAKPRSTEILVAILISENDLNSPAKQAAFARTLRSVIQIVRPEIWTNHASGKGIWKNIVIGIVTNGTVEASSLSVLEEMGVFWNDPDYRKPSVNQKDVLAHLYEVCRSIPKEL